MKNAYYPPARDAWSMVTRLRQATNEYGPPIQIFVAFCTMPESKSETVIVNLLAQVGFPLSAFT